MAAAALDSVLQRFDPVLLEARLGERSLLHSLLPASRQAQLWKLYCQHHASIRSEASEDFHTLFGKAFLSAYYEHVTRPQERRGTDRPEG